MSENLDISKMGYILPHLPLLPKMAFLSGLQPASRVCFYCNRTVMSDCGPQHD